MTEPSEVASGTKLTQGIDPWVAMLLEIRQAMLASPASSDVEAAGVDRYSYVRQDTSILASLADPYS
jgi:hypothetical protein